MEKVSSKVAAAAKKTAVGNKPRRRWFVENREITEEEAKRLTAGKRANSEGKQ